MVRLAFIITMLMVSFASAEEARLDPAEAFERAEQGDITLIDIRLPAEWEETGLPEPAVGVSLQDPSLQPRAGFLDDLLALVDGDRDRPIALICARGNRSAFAQEFLAANGFKQVYDVTEGVVGGINGPGWLGRDLPTVPCTTC